MQDALGDSDRWAASRTLDRVWSNRDEARRQDGLLPKFESVAVAERELFAQRDRALDWLRDVGRKHSVELAPTPGDLESLEALYFELFVERSGWLRRRSRSTFEFSMAVFWGAVAVANDARWSVYESVFAPGHFGLAVNRGHLTVILNDFCSDWGRRPNNRRRRLLRREYDRRFGATQPAEGV